MNAAPTNVVISVRFDTSSSDSPAATLPISLAKGAVSLAARPAAIIAAGGIEGCALCRQISPM